jgi:hypothetical protein
MHLDAVINVAVANAIIDYLLSSESKIFDSDDLNEIKI